MDHDRLLRLQRAARAGELIHAKQGVFESNSCNVCGFHHKVSLLLKNQPPCPGTEAGAMYYVTHEDERILLESFLLNKGMETGEISILNNKQNGREQTSRSCTERRPSWTVRAKSLGFAQEIYPKETGFTRRSSASPRTDVRYETPVKRPATSRGRLLKNRTRQSPAYLPGYGRRASENEENRRGYASEDMPWNALFESELGSSDFSDPEDSDVDGLNRQLVREMYAQEEAALRSKLAKEKEKHELMMR